MRGSIILKHLFIIQLVYLTVSMGLVSCKKTTSTSEPESIPFKIENLGVHFGTWNRQTNEAGDFYFTRAYPRIFNEFGTRALDPEGNIKELPTMDFVIRRDAFVVSISEGEVVRIYQQEDTDDWEFSIQSLNDPSYDIVYDHLVNLRISLGDRVQPGDTLGNPQPRNADVGFVEIMINNMETGLSYCPMSFLDDDKFDEYVQKISQLMDDWEEFMADTTIYDQENHVIPGCRIESMVSY